MFNTDYHVKIQAIPAGIKRPLWSVVIPTYNCAHYLKETIQSVLAQDSGEDLIEIIVVDDHSTQDDPEAVVKAFGKGRVQFIRQAQNVGKSRNYGYGINQSKGHYIHLLHGDDTVSQGFYKEMQDLFEMYPEAAAGFCQCQYINAQSEKTGETKLLLETSGILNDFIKNIAVWQLIQPPSIVFKRTVYETLGSYDLRLKYIEDWEFYARSALQFKFAYIPEPLAQYRVFSENSSSQSVKGGRRVKAIKQVLQIIDGYLPNTLKNEIKVERNQAVALYILNYIPQMVAQNDIKGFLVYTAAFFHYNRNLKLIGRWMRFVFQYKRFL